jgi:hypothetical protein
MTVTLTSHQTRSWLSPLTMPLKSSVSSVFRLQVCLRSPSIRSPLNKFLHQPRIRRRHLRKVCFLCSLHRDPEHSDTLQYSWLPDVFRLKGSVRMIVLPGIRQGRPHLQIIRRIFGPVLTVTMFSALVAYASHRGHEIVLTNSVVPMISVVVRFKLSLRSNSRTILGLGWPYPSIQV